jgi:hypothetical protein
VRAVLHATIDGERDDRLIRLGAGLPYFWYYRARLIEGRRWLAAVVELLAAQPVEAASAAPADLVLARLALAGAGLLTGRTDLAHSMLDLVLLHIPSVADADLIEVGEAIVVVADGAWARGQFDIVARLHPYLAAVAERSSDPILQLNVEKVDVVAGLVSRLPTDTIARATHLYDRAVAMNNAHLMWNACGIMQIACVIADDPVAGFVWTDRAIAAIYPLGTGGSGAFIEGLANCAAIAGDLDDATRWFAAAQAATRRSGMVWPLTPRADELLEHVRANLPSDRFDQLWAAGTRLTIDAIAESRGLLRSPN